MSRKNSIANCETLEEKKEGRTDEDVSRLEIFTVENLESDDENKMSTTTQSVKSGWRSLRDATEELGNDTRKLYKYVKRRISRKKKKSETEVTAIHIVPESDEDMKWASRSTSAHSATSSGTHSSVEREDTHIETVHDMKDEYNVFHGC